MKTTPTTIRHLLFVWAFLSDQNRAELEVLGLSLTDALIQAEAWMKEHGAVTAWLDGQPAFVFGVVGGVTWFAATQDYFGAGLRGLRDGRKFVKEAVEKHGQLTTISYSPHPDAGRWFGFLGFEKKSDDGVERVWVTRDFPSATIST